MLGKAQPWTFVVFLFELRARHGEYNMVYPQMYFPSSWKAGIWNI